MRRCSACDEVRRRVLEEYLPLWLDNKRGANVSLIEAADWSFLPPLACSWFLAALDCQIVRIDDDPLFAFTIEGGGRTHPFGDRKTRLHREAFLTVAAGCSRSSFAGRPIACGSSRRGPRDTPTGAYGPSTSSAMPRGNRRRLCSRLRRRGASQRQSNSGMGLRAAAPAAITPSTAGRPSSITTGSTVASWSTSRPSSGSSGQAPSPMRRICSSVSAWRIAALCIFAGSATDESSRRCERAQANGMRLTSSPIYGGTDSGGGCSSERLNRGVGRAGAGARTGRVAARTGRVARLAVRAWRNEAALESTP